MLHIVDSH